MDCNIAVIQHLVSKDKKENIKKAEEKIREAKAAGAHIIMLPEMFNCPYANTYFPEFAEEYPGGETISFLSARAAEHEIYLVGGTVPEREGSSLYNTCFIFGPQGELLGRHRKMHLFDIDVEGGITFKESDTLSPGSSLTLIETPFGKIGAAICYDMRFPELFRLMALEGAKLVVVPAAFNTTTGPLHWEILTRVRALDNQVYLAAASPARDESPDAVYPAWGHSIIVDPWGAVLKEAGTEEAILIVPLKEERIAKARRDMPLLEHLRSDLYEVRLKD